MDQKRPDCSDFIVATVRKLRRNPANITPGTNSGMGLERLWEVVSKLYSEEEFRRGLEDLSDKDIILITARHHRGKESSSDVTVTKIPNNLDSHHSWLLNDKGEYLDALNSNESSDSFIRRVTIYIRADGLPQIAEHIDRVTCKQSVAQAILEKTMSQPTRFHIGDLVQWREEEFSEMLEDMKCTYGEGPFEVVAVRLHSRQKRESSPDAHPEVVTIELAKESRHEVSGGLLKKI